MICELWIDLPIRLCSVSERGDSNTFTNESAVVYTTMPLRAERRVEKFPVTVKIEEGFF